MSDAPTGGGTLFTEPILVVNQKAKLIEINTEYKISDQHGNQLGAVRQVGQSKAKKVLRFVSNVDQFLSHSFEVVDAGGNTVLSLKQPAKLFKGKLEVSDGTGKMLGRIVQENLIGKITFGIEVDGNRIGSVNGENWRSWNFNIQDAAGVEVGRVTKQWGGMTKEIFTAADNYAVEIDPSLQDPLRTMAVAAAVCIDTALKQDNA